MFAFVSDGNILRKVDVYELALSLIRGVTANAVLIHQWVNQTDSHRLWWSWTFTYEVDSTEQPNCDYKESIHTGMRNIYVLSGIL